MTEILEIHVSEILAGDNDRTSFDQTGLEELAESIKAHGLAQPITVRPLGDGKFQIVAGERRFRAISQILKKETAPCIIREMNDEEASAIMLAENIGRKDLDPVDEAQAYRKRAEKFGWDALEISKRCGVSSARVKRRLTLMNVRADILQLVKSGQFPVGHAEILSVLDHNRQMIASRPLINGDPVSLRQFRSIVDKLQAEQSQDNIFDLALFGGSMIQQVVLEAKKASFPVAPDLPKMTVPEQHHTGALLYEYIQTLLSEGLTREAQIVGTVLYSLDKLRYAYVPNFVERQALTNSEAGG